MVPLFHCFPAILLMLRIQLFRKTGRIRQDTNTLLEFSSLYGNVDSTATCVGFILLLVYLFLSRRLSTESPSRAEEKFFPGK